jgi:hypothetical protein
VKFCGIILDVGFIHVYGKIPQKQNENLSTRLELRKEETMLIPVDNTDE